MAGSLSRTVELKSVADADKTPGNQYDQPPQSKKRMPQL
jgi:hypothetical protein